MTKVNSISQGSFGELALMEGDSLRKATLVATEDTHLATLHK